MKRVLLALAVALAVALVGGAEAKAYPGKYTIKPQIQSVEAPTQVQLERNQTTADVTVTATITWTGNYPYTIKRTPTTVTFAVDGQVVDTRTINPPYKLGDTRTVSATLKLTEGKHTITVTAKFPDLPQYGITGGTATQSVEVTVVAPKPVIPTHLAGAVVKDLLLAVPALMLLDPFMGYPLSDMLGYKTDLQNFLDDLGLREFAENDVGAVLPAMVLATDLLAGWGLDHNVMPNTLSMLDVGTMAGAVVAPLLYMVGSPFSDLIVDIAEDLGLGGTAEVSVASAIGLALPTVSTVLGYLADKGVATAAQIVAPVVKALDQLLTMLASPIAGYLA
ncbi:hypothetical protein [Methanopyrus sp. KOL6]|uniref:hypothetical protein n=1 Tax=Methanopyrus sp. KOL6 TaxID=1937004 RepID=UPI000B4AA1B2|nr:hypothetical protein [Methanopyrus sp. KOL6]